MTNHSPPMATYTNREGEVWPLVEVRPDPHLHGMFWARRADTQEAVHVHQHRMLWVESTPEAAAKEIVSTSTEALEQGS